MLSKIPDCKYSSSGVHVPVRITDPEAPARIGAAVGV